MTPTEYTQIDQRPRGHLPDPGHRLPGRPRGAAHGHGVEVGRAGHHESRSAHAQRPGRHQHHQPRRPMAADRDVEPEAGGRRDGRTVHVRDADLGPVRPAHWAHRSRRATTPSRSQPRSGSSRLPPATRIDRSWASGDTAARSDRATGASRPTVAVAADLNDDDDTPETARTLTPGTTAAGRVHRDEDIDWYSIVVPAGQNSISIDVGGVPTVGVSLTLFDDTGTEVPMTFGEGGSGLQYQRERRPGRHLSRPRRSSHRSRPCSGSIPAAAWATTCRSCTRPCAPTPEAWSRATRRSRSSRSRRTRCCPTGAMTRTCSRTRWTGTWTSPAARAAPRRRSSTPPSSSPAARALAPCCW